MGKYSNLEKDVFSVFSQKAWTDLKIKTYPSNYTATAAGDEFVKISIIPGGSGLNSNSVSGILMADIFVPSGAGPSRGSAVADSLDSFLCRKTLSGAEGAVTQFFTSSVSPLGQDVDNRSLYRFQYQIPFSHFGVL